MAKTPAPSLADEVHKWTFESRGQATNAVAARYRAALRQAQRFVIDDEAVRLVCQLSHDTHKVMEGRSFLARLPYNNLWIEFDLHTKVKEFERMGTLRQKFDPNEVSPEMGLLFYLDGSDTRTRWVCHQFVRNTRGMHLDKEWVGVDPLAFVYDPEGSPLQPLRGSVMWKAPTLSLRPGFPKIPFRVQKKPDGEVEDSAHFGDKPNKVLTLPGKMLTPHCPECATPVEIFELDQGVDPEISVIGLYEVTEHGIKGPDWLVNKTAVIVDPWAEAFATNKERLEALALVECNELAGQFRWIMCLLAAINGLPKDIKPVVSSGRQTVGMHILPYLQHNHLTINLPREDRIRRARVTLERQARNAKRPWHQVIGHWRIIDRGKPLPGYICRHIPAMVDSGLGICEKCEMLIRWIPQHERGDPNIGIVRHTYDVHGKRQTARVELGTDHE